MVKDLHKSWMRIISLEIMNVLRISSLSFTLVGHTQTTKFFSHLSENGSVSMGVLQLWVRICIYIFFYIGLQTVGG